MIFVGVNPFFKIFLYINGNPIKHAKNPILIMLQPRAKSPPSAKNKHWITNTEAIVKNPASGPNNDANKIPPPICPLEPVPGIVKFIICDANTNAPSTPIKGIFLSKLIDLGLSRSSKSPFDNFVAE